MVLKNPGLALPPPAGYGLIMNIEKKPLKNHSSRPSRELVDGHPITSIGRWASLDDYNRWLRDYLEAGGEPTHDYDYKWSGLTFCYVKNPYTMPDLNGNRMGGSGARHFIVPKQYNFSTYADKLAVGNNNVYGWENGYPVATARHPLTPWVPTYLNTVDKLIAQQAEQEAYARYMAEATSHAKKISPRKVYTVQELVTLLAWIPEDFQVTGVRVTPPK